MGLGGGGGVGSGTDGGAGGGRGKGTASGTAGGAGGTGGSDSSQWSPCARFESLDLGTLRISEVLRLESSALLAL